MKRNRPVAAAGLTVTHPRLTGGHHHPARRKPAANRPRTIVVAITQIKITIPYEFSNTSIHIFIGPQVGQHRGGLPPLLGLMIVLKFIQILQQSITYVHKPTGRAEPRGGTSIALYVSSMGV